MVAQIITKIQNTNKMTTKNKFSENNFNATIDNTLLSAVFLDINGNELKKGDKVIMTLKGLGSGEMDIVEHENELCLYDATQGYYPLKFAIKRDDILLERLS